MDHTQNHPHTPSPPQSPPHNNPEPSLEPEPIYYLDIDELQPVRTTFPTSSARDEPVGPSQPMPPARYASLAEQDALEDASHIQNRARITEYDIDVPVRYFISQGVYDDGTLTKDYPPVQAFLEALAKDPDHPPPAPDVVFALAALSLALHPVRRLHWVFWCKKKREETAEIVDKVWLTRPDIISSPIGWAGKRSMINLIANLQIGWRSTLSKLPWFAQYAPNKPPAGARGYMALRRRRVRREGSGPGTANAPEAGTSGGVTRPPRKMPRAKAIARAVDEAPQNAPKPLRRSSRSTRISPTENVVPSEVVAESPKKRPRKVVLITGAPNATDEPPRKRRRTTTTTIPTTADVPADPAADPPKKRPRTRRIVRETDAPSGPVAELRKKRSRAETNETAPAETPDAVVELPAKRLKTATATTPATVATGDGPRKRPKTRRIVRTGEKTESTKEAPQPPSTTSPDLPPPTQPTPDLPDTKRPAKAKKVSVPTAVPVRQSVRQKEQKEKGLTIRIPKSRTNSRSLMDRGSEGTTAVSSEAVRSTSPTVVGGQGEKESHTGEDKGKAKEEGDVGDEEGNRKEEKKEKKKRRTTTATEPEGRWMVTRLKARQKAEEEEKLSSVPPTRSSKKWRTAKAPDTKDTGAPSASGRGKSASASATATLGKRRRGR